MNIPTQENTRQQHNALLRLLNALLLATISIVALRVAYNHINTVWFTHVLGVIQCAHKTMSYVCLLFS
jgi:hypothetical protein